jgi:DNA-binding transcriptional MerR regulator
MLNIGHFARHCRVSLRMLRHYDGIGLPAPLGHSPKAMPRHATK